MEKISFVIPCYHSENTIEKVIDEIDMVMSSLNYDYEVIMVNDNPPDNTWTTIRNIAEQQNNKNAICLSRNFGQHSALLAGYHHCTGDIIVSLDDDGQSPVDEVELLIDKIHEGYDVVYGRYAEIKQNTFRILGSWLNEKMSEMLLGKPKGIKGNSFNAMRRFVVKEMLRYENAYPYLEGLVMRTTRNISNVIVHHRSRQEGTSGYTIKKLIKLWVNGFTAFSEKPLRVASVFGVICALLGFGTGVITVIRKLLNPNMQLGYASVIASIFFAGHYRGICWSHLCKY